MQSMGVSREHLEIWTDGNICYCKDMKSTNGVYVNGKKIKSNTRHILKDNDALTLKTRLTDTRLNFACTIRAFDDETGALFSDDDYDDDDTTKPSTKPTPKKQTIPTPLEPVSVAKPPGDKQFAPTIDKVLSVFIRPEMTAAVGAPRFIQEKWNSSILSCMVSLICAQGVKMEITAMQYANMIAMKPAGFWVNNMDNMRVETSIVNTESIKEWKKQAANAISRDKKINLVSKIIDGLYRWVETGEPDWEYISTLKQYQVAPQLMAGPIFNRKTRYILELLLRHAKDGYKSFETMTISQIVEELTNKKTKLKSFGSKSIACLLLYQLRRPFFAADVNVIKIFGRLGLLGTYEEVV